MKELNFYDLLPLPLFFFDSVVIALLGNEPAPSSVDYVVIALLGNEPGTSSVDYVVVLQVFNACDYIHNARHVIHYDLKPENILLSNGLLSQSASSRVLASAVEPGKHGTAITSACCVVLVVLALI